jgi:hypothetical protein
MLETRERPMKDPFIDVLDVFPWNPHLLYSRWIFAVL